jgi:hypothetical protein
VATAEPGSHARGRWFDPSRAHLRPQPSRLSSWTPLESSEDDHAKARRKPMVG